MITPIQAHGLYPMKQYTAGSIEPDWFRPVTPRTVSQYTDIWFKTLKTDSSYLTIEQNSSDEEFYGPINE